MRKTVLGIKSVLFVNDIHDIHHKKKYLFHSFITLRKSWISWISWISSIFMICKFC